MIDAKDRRLLARIAVAALLVIGAVLGSAIVLGIAIRLFLWLAWG